VTTGFPSRLHRGGLHQRVARRWRGQRGKETRLVPGRAARVGAAAAGLVAVGEVAAMAMGARAASVCVCVVTVEAPEPRLGQWWW
jgi:hypothetical protein